MGLSLVLRFFFNSISYKVSLHQSVTKSILNNVSLFCFFPQPPLYLLCFKLNVCISSFLEWFQNESIIKKKELRKWWIWWNHHEKKWKNEVSEVIFVCSPFGKVDPSNFIVELRSSGCDKLPLGSVELIIIF